MSTPAFLCFMAQSGKNRSIAKAKRLLHEFNDVFAFAYAEEVGYGLTLGSKQKSMRSLKLGFGERLSVAHSLRHNEIN